MGPEVAALSGGRSKGAVAKKKPRGLQRNTSQASMAKNNIELVQNRMNGLERLGRVVSELLEDDDDIFVLFSAIWTFGHRLELRRDSAARLLDTVQEAIGPMRTLVLPTYTFGFPRTRQFDLVRTRPETGILPDMAVKAAGFVRSHNPIVSHIAYGPRAHELLTCRQTTAWGDDSVMQWFEASRARVAVLGIPWGQGCGFIHRAEEKSQVPYRYFKRFQGQLLADEIAQGECTETLYVRPLGVDLVRGYETIDRFMPDLTSFRISSDADIPAASAIADEITTLSMRLLADDPYCYVENADEVRMWVAQSMQNEIASLSPEQRPL